ncbi:MAG: YdeI/OmpD-associated family protein [Chloroflexota bacterium]
MEAFEASLQSEGEGAGFFLEVPAAVVVALGKGKRPPVLVTLNGYLYRTTIAVYGGRYYVGVRREVREAAGISPDAVIAVTIALDEAPRLVALPDDLRLALAANLDAEAAFARLSFTHRKEYVDWVTSAKHDETRRRRIAKTVATVREGMAGAKETNGPA